MINNLPDELFDEPVPKTENPEELTGIPLWKFLCDKSNNLTAEQNQKHFDRWWKE